MPEIRPASGGIFMCYRRQDTAYAAAWLYQELRVRFGRERIFKDIDDIDPGDNFVQRIGEAVGSCAVLLAMIGDRWTAIEDEDGRRRLDDPQDYVRREIEEALDRGVRVIPLLIAGARMPRAEQLPDTLTGLTQRHAVELSPERFDTDLRRLMEVLDRTLADAGAAPAQDTPKPSTEAVAGDPLERAQSTDPMVPRTPLGPAPGKEPGVQSEPDAQHEPGPSLEHGSGDVWGASPKPQSAQTAATPFKVVPWLLLLLLAGVLAGMGGGSALSNGTDYLYDALYWAMVIAGVCALMAWGRFPWAIGASVGAMAYIACSSAVILLGWYRSQTVEEDGTWVVLFIAALAGTLGGLKAARPHWRTRSEIPASAAALVLAGVLVELLAQTVDGPGYRSVNPAGYQWTTPSLLAAAAPVLLDLGGPLGRTTFRAAAGAVVTVGVLDAALFAASSNASWQRAVIVGFWLAGLALFAAGVVLAALVHDRRSAGVRAATG
jgi:hypothetical protein